MTTTPLPDDGEALPSKPCDSPSTAPFPTTQLDDVAGCLSYTGPLVSMEEMESAIEKSARTRTDRD